MRLAAARVTSRRASGTPSEVVLDRTRADEQSSGDLSIGVLPRATRREICASCGVSWEVSTVRLRACSPVASSSILARSAKASIPKPENRSYAKRSCSRVEARRVAAAIRRTGGGHARDRQRFGVRPSRSIASTYASRRHLRREESTSVPPKGWRSAVRRDFVCVCFAFRFEVPIVSMRRRSDDQEHADRGHRPKERNPRLPRTWRRAPARTKAATATDASPSPAASRWHDRASVRQLPESSALGGSDDLAEDEQPGSDQRSARVQRGPASECDRAMTQQLSADASALATATRRPSTAALRA